MILQSDYQRQRTDEAAWADSPFGWLRIGPSSRQKGTIGEKLVSDYLACKGFDVSRSPDSEADRIVGGKRVEIKMSTLWEKGFYRFQQLRDQNYDFAICLGLSPFDAHCWVLPKEILIERMKTGDIPHQHGGAEGRDTAWLTVNPEAVPEWLNEWGGRLGTAIELITRLTGQEPLT